MKRFLTIGCIAILIAGAVIFGGPVARGVESSWTVFYEVLDIIHREYVDRDVNTTDLIYGAIRGMLAALDDPYTRFMDPQAFTETKVHMNGEFYGVGIQIGIKNNSLTVISPIEGTPANQAGIKALDVITSINGESTEGISLEQAVSKIRGPKGTKVILGIRRKDVEQEMKISIIRDAIKLKSVSKTKMLTKRIGYIQLATFESKEATHEMGEAIQKLAADKQIAGLILDLRNNGGGLLRNAIQIASIFLDDGPVVQTVDRDGQKEVLSVMPQQVRWKKPVVVIINEASASASEILAGAIQDHGRGLIIGTHSFGKASVQNVRPLADGSAVLITVAKYLTPKGTDISKTGILPDVEVGFSTENVKAMSAPDYVYNEKDDVQLQKAISIMQGLLNGEPAKKSRDSVIQTNNR